MFCWLFCISNFSLTSLSPLLILYSTRGPLSLRAHLHLHCLSIRVRVCARPWQNCVYTTSKAWIRGHPSPWPFWAKFGSNHVNSRLWVRTFHNLGGTRTSASEEMATCSDELGHRRPRQKSQTQNWISVNTKHQLTCFDCVRAWTRILGPRSRL